MTFRDLSHLSFFDNSHWNSKREKGNTYNFEQEEGKFEMKDITIDIVEGVLDLIEESLGDVARTDSGQSTDEPKRPIKKKLIVGIDTPYEANKVQGKSALSQVLDDSEGLDQGFILP